MQLLPGAITLRELQKVEESANNPGIVDIGNATPLVALPSIDVTAGDIIVACCHHGIVRGAANGYVEVNLQKRAGTATIVIVHNQTSCSVRHYTIAGETVRITFTAIVRITGGGTLTLGNVGWSEGLNSSLPAQSGQLYAWLYRGGA